MDNLFGALLLIGLVMFVTGLISPKTSLFWYKQKQTRGFSSLIYGALIFLSFILFGVFSAKNLPAKEANTENATSNNANVELTQFQKDSVAAAQKAQEIEERKKITFTAGDLTSYYTDNEVKADNNFKGKEFYVVGYVSHIGKDILDNSYATLKSADGFREVQCFVEDQNVLADLNTGQKITVYGKCDGLMMNVLMKNCKVVKNLD